MMKPTKSLDHPSAQEWEDFLVGRMAEPELERLAVHLESCATCQETLPQRLPADPLISRLRQPLQVERHSTEEECRRTLESLRCQGPGEVGTSALAVRAALAQDAASTPGQVIAGYEIQDVLGRGGMGVVYKARQTALKRTVALKMILAGPHASPQELTRFRTEAEAVARLQHPLIVQIYEVGEHEGRPFISLEFVDGCSLAAHLAGQPQPAWSAAELVETLARAMHYAHERGIIHRDLKPANILLQNCRMEIEKEESLDQSAICNLQSAIPKVTDFGLAKQMDEAVGQTHTGAIVGTPSYMAPEQAAGRTKDIGPQVDVYALGAILYEMLTGRPPFKAATVLDTLDQVRQSEPIAPRQLQPNVPRDLEMICLQAMNKEPQGRYPSAQALADDLRRFLDGQAVRARRIGLLEHGQRWLQNPERVRDASAILLFHGSLRAMLALLGLASGVVKYCQDTLESGDALALAFIASFSFVLLWAGWRAREKSLPAVWAGLLVAFCYLLTKVPAIINSTASLMDPMQLVSLPFLYSSLCALQIIACGFALVALVAERRKARLSTLG